MKEAGAQVIKSIHCPTCYGPLPKEVLTEPVQCIYCDVWVATCDGRQQKMILDRHQAMDLRNGIQPSEPVFREGSPLDRLFGRIRRVAPVVIGFPMVWVLMMHLYVGAGWVGPRALPMGDMNAVGFYTFVMCVATAITGYSMLSALILLSMSLSDLSLLLTYLSTSDDVVQSLESESGIMAMFQIGIPIVLVVVWGMMQSTQSIQWSLKKLWVAKLRFGVAMTLGLAVSFAYFSRPTNQQYMESKKEEFTKQADVFAKLCSMEWSSENPTTEPIVPVPKLEFLSWKDHKGNVETIACSRAISNDWVSNYLQEKQHPELRMNTKMMHFLDLLHRSYFRDDFLTPKYEASVNAALSAPYWLLYDPQCLNGAPITAKLYDAKTHALLRRLKIPCSSDETKDRRALFDALKSETGGVFTLDY